MKLALLFLLVYLLPLKGDFACAQIYSERTQKPEPIVGKLLSTEIVEILENFEISNDFKILTCKDPGIYYISLSIQPALLNLGINGYLDYWFEINGKPVSASTTRQSLTQNNPVSLVSIPFLLSLNANDSISTRIAASGPDIGITSIQGTTIQPSLPSFSLLIFKVEDQ